MTSTGKPLVVYVEDDEEDQELCRFALEDSNVAVDMQFISDGQSAMEAIDAYAADETRTNRPRLVLLDLSMPAVNGWDLLTHIRSKSELYSIAVVVFTTSNSPSDMQKAYRMGANAYMVKPAGLEALSECFCTTIKYWTEIVPGPV